jgi:hypothetical protein
MILEHQSSNSTEYQQGDKVIPEERAITAMFWSGATFSVADIRRVRWLLKCLGVSPFTLAKTIELQAWRGIEPWLTPKILRAVGHQEGHFAVLINSS